MNVCCCWKPMHIVVISNLSFVYRVNAMVPYKLFYFCCTADVILNFQHCLAITEFLLYSEIPLKVAHRLMISWKVRLVIVWKQNLANLFMSKVFWTVNTINIFFNIVYGPFNFQQSAKCHSKPPTPPLIIVISQAKFSKTIPIQFCYTRYTIGYFKSLRKWRTKWNKCWHEVSRGDK